MPIPVTTYVAYQKETSPAYGPPFGGYHGIINRKVWTRMLKMTMGSHARKAARGRLSRERRQRTRYSPVAINRVKSEEGYTWRSVTTLLSVTWHEFRGIFQAERAYWSWRHRLLAGPGSWSWSKAIWQSMARVGCRRVVSKPRIVAKVERLVWCIVS